MRFAEISKRGLIICKVQIDLLEQQHINQNKIHSWSKQAKANQLLQWNILLGIWEPVQLAVHLPTELLVGDQLTQVSLGLIW